MSRLVFLLVVVSAIGIGLRVAGMHRAYWFDELATVTNVDVPDLKTVIHDTAEDNQPPLYNSMVFEWIRAFGYSEIAVRSLSLLIGLLGLATPWLARNALSRSEKLWNLAILSLMPLPIRYAQEARNYSLLFLLSAVCLYSYYEILKTRATGRIHTIFHVGLICLAFTHVFGLMLSVSFLAVMFWRERRAAWRIGLVLYAGALSAAVVIPLILGGSGRLAGGNFWITFGPASLALQLVKVFTPIGLLLLAWLWAARWRNPPPSDPALKLALAPFALMLAGAILVSFNTPIITERNLIGLVPAFALLTAWLIEHAALGRPTWWVGLSAGLLALQAIVWTLSPYLFIQQDFRAIARHSIASNSPVCYVVPTRGDAEELPHHLFSFYITKIFHRPDLTPKLIRPSEVPADPAASDCVLWSAATLPKRGESYLRTMPQFAHCTDVPLAAPGVLLASELLSCGR